MNTCEERISSSYNKRHNKFFMGEDRKGNCHGEQYLWNKVIAMEVFAQQSLYDPETWEFSYQFLKRQSPVFFPI